LTCATRLWAEDVDATILAGPAYTFMLRRPKDKAPAKVILIDNFMKFSP
jgi:hypothetical protein